MGVECGIFKKSLSRKNTMSSDNIFKLEGKVVIFILFSISVLSVFRDTLPVERNSRHNANVAKVHVGNTLY